MAVASRRQSVGTTAVKLNTATTDTVSGQSLIIRPSGGTVHIGAVDVSSTTGFTVNDGESVTVDLDVGEGIYAVAASGTVTVHLLEVGV